MAAKFVVAVALIALCRGNPVLINGEVYRDGRAFSIGEAYNNGAGVSQALAKTYGDVAQAFGSSTNNAQLARDGYYYPAGSAIAQAQANEAPETSGYGTAKAVAQNGGYYTVPEPATVITYEQNFAAPSDASVATAFSKDGGIAESSAKTQQGLGSYGLTSSNAKSSGSGSAQSTSKSGYGSAITTANTQGFGSAASTAQNNGAIYNVVPVETAVPTQQQTIIDAKSPIFYTSYVPNAPQGVASANANSFGSGNAASSAKITHGRTISWRFGTLYDSPAAARADSYTQPGFGAAKSTAYTQGSGSAKSYATSPSAGPSTAESSAASYGAGSAKANANVNGAAYGNVRYIANVPTAYYRASGGAANANAQTQGHGNAASFARTQGENTADSRATSYGSGSARADASSV